MTGEEALSECCVAAARITGDGPECSACGKICDTRRERLFGGFRGNRDPAFRRAAQGIARGVRERYGDPGGTP